MSWSIGVNISNALKGKTLPAGYINTSNLIIGYSFLDESIIAQLPKELRKDIQKKKSIDQATLISFCILFLLILLHLLSGW